jgi:hypothetical protein
MPKQTPAASSLPPHGRHLGHLALRLSRRSRQDLSPIPRHEAHDSFFKSLLDLSVHIWRDMPQRRQTAITLTDTPLRGVSDPHPSPCSSPRASVASWLDQDRRPDNSQRYVRPPPDYNSLGHTRSRYSKPPCSAVPCAPLALPTAARLGLALPPVTRCLALGPASHKRPSPTRHCHSPRSMPAEPAASACKSSVPSPFLPSSSSTL